MNVIDLFAGCGGLSLGFELAGFRVLAANERDSWAASTFRRNHPTTRMVEGDISDPDTNAALQEVVNGVSIHGIVGGPPCQGFSLSGNRDPKDPRNSLFMDFLRAVRLFRPRFFVMENVTGLLSMRTANGEKVIDILRSEFRTAGYRATYKILNAAWFGVPQSRERIFIIGLDDALPFDESQIFPRSCLLSSQYVTAWQAISDLPQIESGEGEEVQNYLAPAANEFQEWAREGSTDVRNHVAMRHTARLIERFKIISWGQSVAHVPFEHSALKRGDPNSKSGKTFSQNNMRVFPDRPSPTVAASFQSNFIHPYLHRNFTAREGARLQSFPDRYIFEGRRTTMSWEKNLSQYQQIGNAVPPLMARAVANSLRAYLSHLDRVEHRPDPTIGYQLNLV